MPTCGCSVPAPEHRCGARRSTLAAPKRRAPLPETIIGTTLARLSLALAGTALLIGLLGGCATVLPALDDRQASTHLTDTADTRLGRAIGAVAGQYPGASGVVALSAPRDAFAARVLLMRAADRSLDLQYYIWHADTTGVALLEEVRRAAGRGVRVRLLLDDNGIAGLDPDLAALDAHPDIEVRLFNPYLQRGFKALGYLSEFERLNHRMHNKSLTADTQATIVGGRNVGDVYFGADPDLAFVDLDVLAVGPVARDVARAFDEYWNSASAYPARSIIGAPDARAMQSLDGRLAALRESEAAASYAAAVARTPLLDQLLAGRLALEWVPARVFYDPPAKAVGAVADADLLLGQLMLAVGGARRELDLVSPYFVPGETGTAALARLAAQGVRLRIVTNSLAATDVTAVHAGYAKRRKDLLRAGIRLYELKPDPDAAKPAEDPKKPDARGSGLSLTGSSGASLHGKTFAADGERVFVGSFNLDPRSTRLNTEMGLVIESQVLAALHHSTLDRKLPAIAYELRLTADGELEWIEQTDAGELRHRSEPKAGLGRRVSVRILSWLPIEWLL
jgi:cardiolipin synthase C